MVWERYPILAQIMKTKTVCLGAESQLKQKMLHDLFRDPVNFELKGGCPNSWLLFFLCGTCAKLVRVYVSKPTAERCFFFFFFHF